MHLLIITNQVYLLFNSSIIIIIKLKVKAKQIVIQNKNNCVYTYKKHMETWFRTTSLVHVQYQLDLFPQLLQLS